MIRFSTYFPLPALSSDESNAWPFVSFILEQSKTDVPPGLVVLKSNENSISALMLTGPELVLNHRVSQSIAGTVKASPRVESKSIAAVSARAEWYRSAKSATVGPTGKLQSTSASRESGLSTASE